MPPGSRNKVAPVAAERGNYDDIPDHDLEARWVEDAAAAQPDSEEEAGEERKNCDTLEDQAEAPGTRAKANPKPSVGHLRASAEGRNAPAEGRHQTAVTLKACGLPRDPRFGRAAPSEHSEMMVPVPLATASEELVRREPSGEPWLFEDGPRPDDEALLMVAGPQQASRLPHARLTELANADLSADYVPSDAETQPAAASAPPPARASAKGPGEGGQKRDSAGGSATGCKEPGGTQEGTPPWKPHRARGVAAHCCLSGPTASQQERASVRRGSVR